MKLYQGNLRPPPFYRYWRDVTAEASPNQYSGVYLHYNAASLYQAQVQAIRVTAANASTFLLAYADEIAFNQWLRGLNYGWNRKISDFGTQVWHGDQAPVSNLSVPADQATGQVIDLSAFPITLEAPGALLVYAASLNEELVVDLWWDEHNLGWSRDAAPYNPPPP